MTEGRLSAVDTELTDAETERFCQWIIAHVDAQDIPGDEGNTEALVYNLVHKLRDGDDYQRYCYAADQDAEIAQWFPDRDDDY